MLKNILTVLLLAVGLCTYAHELNGTVISAENEKPLQGVGVYNKNTGAYTYTNVSGYFELDDISVGDVVYFYQLGFENYELTIDESHLDSTINIILEISSASLDQVLIVSKVNVLSSFVNVDLKTTPVKTSQEILRKIPGLFIGQHAGGGKAEQIFLRGFDIDHGTDIAIDVDGMPVNMVSHAHGQGYADMHFIIPETIENLDFGKGSYYADKGNFNTAGYVDIVTKKKIDKNVISVEAGQFNTVRAMSMLKIWDGENSNAYVASELNLTDGVFDSPQNFNRLNIMGRYNYNNFKDQEFNLSLSHFQSKWDASGQIPQRAVDSGLIGRFGAIDDTEGGNTSRTNIWMNHIKHFDEHTSLTSSAYVSQYDFELFSNFTFLLEDPVNGDQIRQYEDRTIIGAKSVYEKSFHLADHEKQLKYRVGVGFRYDDVNDNQLSRTRNRQELLERLAYGNVDEANGFAFADLNYKCNKWTLNPGVRVDYFNFGYENLLMPTYDSRSENDVIVSPKFNAIYSPNEKLQLFAKTGLGYHSNDSRLVVATREEIQTQNPDLTITDIETLPSAFSVDLGTVWKPTSKLVVNAAFWSLWLEQEFVYVGDAGIVEPSGKTRRLGIDFGLRYQIADWLYFNTDVNYAHARSTEEPDGQDYIPLAPDLTSAGGFSFKELGKFSGSINYRYIKDRPANEDNSIVAEGYFVTDFNINYSCKNWTFGLIVENLFDVDWNETQFATESRLMGEADSVEEIHFTPGAPFFLRGKVSVRF
ncbi:carboxypeptidase-like regulatory domain-containing protein [Hyunsoonleella sp. SJ7]|uniref:Carboxypeptidase-like regulatory domain-containing protein n=1 Tax=Hyunsoonleella aquatilis TaxID=2762758 RepID=A0A923HCU6_9FLAO|nr:TonB-dependent receptor plug domain-containing protein [Hyunsoonleella aquatilis]MBC3759104.1 carboxypeptidase-like regulatory domain-containing protein [Hyunsoonleella aquatilis]